MKFAKDHANWSPDQWRNILRLDENKVIMFGGKGSRSYFRRPKNPQFKPQYTTRTIKHVRRSVMVWACFSYYGVGPIHWNKAIVDQHVYVDIMATIMLPLAEYEIPLV